MKLSTKLQDINKATTGSIVKIGCLTQKIDAVVAVQKNEFGGSCLAYKIDNRIVETHEVMGIYI